jgi:hypothetical protein
MNCLRTRSHFHYISASNNHDARGAHLGRHIFLHALHSWNRQHCKKKIILIIDVLVSLL